MDIAVKDMKIPINGTVQVPVHVTVDDTTDVATYKVALGVADDDIGVAKYLTIAVGQEPPATSLEGALEGALSGLFTESGEPVTIESIIVDAPEDEDGATPEPDDANTP